MNFNNTYAILQDLAGHVDQQLKYLKDENQVCIKLQVNNTGSLKLSNCIFVEL